jgi:crossover junction endodeoxyribonuclease RuvC
MSGTTLRLIGLDPGLRRTGWGVIDMNGQHLKYVADGVVTSDETGDLAQRLGRLWHGLNDVIDRWRPDAAAVEESFVNKNPASTLKLGMARGVVLLAPSLKGLAVAEYAPNLIKKSITGSGHADKIQVQTMVRRLLPGALAGQADAADALAVAICHAHHATSSQALTRVAVGIGR